VHLGTDSLWLLLNVNGLVLTILCGSALANQRLHAFIRFQRPVQGLLLVNGRLAKVFDFQMILRNFALLSPQDVKHRRVGRQFREKHPCSEITERKNLYLLECWLCGN